MTDVWDDLADSELRMRLQQRGVSANEAVVLVHHRDDEWAAARIEQVINP